MAQISFRNETFSFLFPLVTSVTHPTEEYDTHICTMNYCPQGNYQMRQWAETSICVDQFHDPSVPIELWHLNWPCGTDGLKCRHIRISQTAQRHFSSRLPITHRPINGIHVATGNSHDQLAYDLTYSCTHIHSKHRAPGSDYTSNDGYVLSSHLHAMSDGWTSAVI